MEAMGKRRLSGTAQTRCDSSRSLEHQQIGAWPVALVENPRVDVGATGEVF